MSYTPGIWNIPIYRGSTLRQPFIRKVSRDGAAFDLTGYGAKALIYTVRNVTNVDTPVMTLTVQSGGIIITPTDGKVEMYVPDTTVTSTLTAQKYYYDLFLIQPNTDVIPFMTGEIIFT